MRLICCGDYGRPLSAPLTEPVVSKVRVSSVFRVVCAEALSIRAHELAWPPSRAELLLDRGMVDPDPFALDLPVGRELEHVEQPEACTTAHAVAEERVAVGDLTRPDRLIDEEVISVE